MSCTKTHNSALDFFSNYMYFLFNITKCNFVIFFIPKRGRHSVFWYKNNSSFYLLFILVSFVKLCHGIFFFKKIWKSTVLNVDVTKWGIITQPAYGVGPLSACQPNTIGMAFP